MKENQIFNILIPPNNRPVRSQSERLCVPAKPTNSISPLTHSLRISISKTQQLHKMQLPSIILHSIPSSFPYNINVKFNELSVSVGTCWIFFAFRFAAVEAPFVSLFGDLRDFLRRCRSVRKMSVKDKCFLVLSGVVVFL